MFWWAFSVVSCLWEFRKGLPVCWFVCVKACFLCFYICVSQCQVVGPSVLRWQNRTTGASQRATRCSSRKYDLFLKYTFIEVRFITPLWLPLSWRCRLCYESIILGHPGQEKVSEDMLYTMCALFRSKESFHSRLVTSDSMSIWARSKVTEIQ